VVVLLRAVRIDFQVLVGTGFYGVASQESFELPKGELKQAEDLERTPR
jgi:hypothetical protein